MMKNSQKINVYKYKTVSRVITMLAVLFFVSPAYADIARVTLLSHSPGTIEVASDGSAYTAPVIALVSLSAQLRVELDAEVSGRVKKWEAWVKIRKEGGPWIHFSDDSKSAAYFAVPRPKKVDTVADVTVTYGSLFSVLTGNCNAMANGLRASGMSDQQIFEQDRTITFDVDGELSYEMTGIAGTPTPAEVVDYSDKKLHLICKASPLPEPANPTRNTPDVDDASLSVLEMSTMNGACKLDLSGVITTHDANTEIQFRYKDNDGNQSDVKTVITDHAKTAMFNHQYRLYGGGNKQGQIRIDMVGENSSSPWANYDVDCGTNAAPTGVIPVSGIKRTDLAEDIADNFQQEAQANPAQPIENYEEITPDANTKGQVVATFVGSSNKIGVDLPKPDLIATTLGMNIHGVSGFISWGGSAQIENPASASAKGLGPDKDLCRFTPIRFRPFNKGLAPSGPFETTVYRNDQPIHSFSASLEAQSTSPINNGWHEFSLDLPQGTSTIKVVLDSSSAVDESDELNNIYTVNVDVSFSCNSPVGGLAVTGLKGGASPQPAIPGGLKPSCKLGKIPVMENGFWQCKQPDFKAESKPQQAIPGAGLKPSCKLGKIPVMENGFWQCKQPRIKPESKPQQALPGAGPKPNCKLGKIPVMENGAWQCKQPRIKSESKPQQVIPGAGSRPNCKLGKIPVLNHGIWQCKQPDIKVREKRGEF